MSTHGTDQYLVQRYLCTSKPSSATLALLSSGAVVLVQFIGFLFIGVLLFAYYQPHTAAEYALAGVKDSGIPATFPFPGGDAVFPDFITKHMPTGLSGLVVAAIFAAALSSSLNSIAATATNDLYKPFARDKSDSHLLRVASILTIIVGVVQIAIAIALRNSGTSALINALTVAGLINGPILGVFLTGAFVKRAGQTAALVAMVSSISLMTYIFLTTKIAWPWYPLIGSSVTVLVAFIVSLVFKEGSANEEAR
jgi:Na+/proline symporter